MNVSELTVDELAELIQTHAYIATDEALLDLFGDPDEESHLKEDVSQQLSESVESVRRGQESLLTLSELMKRLRSEEDRP